MFACALLGAAAALFSAASCLRARVAIAFSNFAVWASSSVSWPVLGAIGMGGARAACVVLCAALHRLFARLPLPVVTVSTLSFALTLSVLLWLVLLLVEALLLPSRL